MMNIVNPATGEVIRKLKEDGKSSLQKKGERLHKAQKEWAETPLEERIACLQRFKHLLEVNKEELATTLTLEVGKPIREARNEIDGACYRVQFFLDHAKKTLLPQTIHEISGVREVLDFDPLGVIVHLSAWNYPYLIAMNVLPPALIAGNAVLYKPSEFATLSGLHIQNLLYQSGVPKEVSQTAIGGERTGKALLELPFDGYFFTGSYPTGQSISKVLAGRLVPQVLELGGKDPLYVTEDVDIPWSAAAAVEGSFYNAGQSCCAVERIYVHQGVYEKFIVAFREEIKKLKMGNPLNEDTTLGPVTRAAHLPVLTRQIQDAVRRGARLLTGGKKVSGKGNFFEPTVLTKVNHTMRIMKEETFGPLIGIQKVKNDEEAIRLMQDTEYGLTAAVFSKNEERARGILKKLNVGTGYWNCCDRVSPFLPWSGRKHSGLGATLSTQGILAFIRPKSYHLRNHPAYR